MGEPRAGPSGRTQFTDKLQPYHTNLGPMSRKRFLRSS
jgi:hypothetical protein